MIKEIMTLASLITIVGGLVVIPVFMFSGETKYAILYALFAMISCHYIWIMKLELDIKKLKEELHELMEL